jgi:hypothetical protein
MTKAVFEGLVFDDHDHALAVAYVGDEPTYVVLEDGFKYHVDARKVDGQIIASFRGQIEGNQDLVSEGMMKMMGKDDLFTKAAVTSALKNMDKNLAQLFETGIPEQARQYLGMMGFRVTINRHGDVVDINLPATATDEE